MKTTRNRRVLVFAFLLAATLLASIAYAGLIVIYPINAPVTEYKPPVVFDYGSNANKTGLKGSELTVKLGPQNTSAELTLQATYQITYIHDILYINNTDGSHAYYVAVNVSKPIVTTECAIQYAYMILRNSTNHDLLFNLSLTESGTSTEIQLPAGKSLSVNFQFIIPESKDFSDGATCDLKLRLIYSPVSGESGNAQYVP